MYRRFAALALLLGLGAWAQPLPTVFRHATGPGSARTEAGRRWSARATLDGRLFDAVSAERLQAARAEGKAVRIGVNPAAGLTLPVTLESAEIWNNGETVSWQGSVDTPLPGLFRLSMTGEAVTGYLAAGDGRVYEFSGTAGDLTVSEVDRSRVNEQCPVPADPEGKAAPVRAAMVDAPERRESAGPASVIDVLVLYTTAAKNAAGGETAIVNQIRDAVSYTNQAYANTGLAMRIALAGTAEVTYTETGSCSTSLDAVTNPSDGQMDNAETLRTQYGADLVSLWTQTGDCGGIAWVLRTNSTSSARYGYSVTIASSPAFWRNISFAHELGHNLGAAHDRANASSQGLFPYSYGYQSIAAQPYGRDIMAYQCSGGIDCPTVQYFSSPLVTYGGRPLGVPVTEPNSADVAQTFTQSAATVEAYRPRASGSAVTVTPTSISATASGGVFSVTVTAATAWTASTTTAWISGIAPASGTGNAQVSFSVAANQSGAARSGSVQIGGVTVVVQQAGAGSCPETPIAAGATVNGTLGTGSCTSPIRGNTLAQRYSFSGSAGQQVALTMSSTAFDTHLYLIGPAGTIVAENGDSSGTNSRIPAVSGWFSLPSSGTYVIEATSFTAGASGAFTLSFTVPGCTYSISPTSLSVPAEQTLRNVTVTASAAGCGWTASPGANWISVTSGSAGSGSGTVSLQMAANVDTAARSGAVTIAGISLTVNQASPSSCAAPAINLNTPTPGTLSSTGVCRSLYRGSDYNAARFSFAGTAGQQIRIMEESPAFDAYLYLVGPNGQVVAEDDDGAGNLNAAIPNLTGYITLPTTGTYTIEATAFDGGADGPFWLVVLPAGGGDTARLVSGVASPVTLPSTAAGTYFPDRSAAWQIVVPSDATRLEVQLTTQTPGADNDLFVHFGGIAGLSDQGYVLADHSAQTLSGNESIVVTPTSSPVLRAGTYYITLASFASYLASAGTLTATVTAPSVPTASVTLSATSATVGAGGGSGSVTVTPTPSDYSSWTVTGAPAWLTATKSGNTVNWTATANGSVSGRNATLNIGGQSYSVTQAGMTGSVALSASSATAPAAGGSGSVTVTPTPSDYSSWTVTGAPSWFTATKSGNTVNWTAAANNSVSSRTATLSIGGQSYTVTQSGMTGSVSLSTPSASATASGGSGSVTVTPTPSDYSSWTVTGAPSWLTATKSGNSVNWTAAANNSVSSRTATLNIGGQSYSVTQTGAAGSVALGATAATVPATGGSGSVTVTPTPADYSSWAVTGAPTWLVANKTVNAVSWTATANNSVASRSATLNIGGQSYSVSQIGAAGSVVLSGTSANVAATGGSGSITVTPSPADYTSWTVSGAPSWLTAVKSGNTVNWTAAANTGAGRSATLNIGGATFSLSQAAGSAPIIVQTPISGSGLSKTFQVQYRSPAGLDELGVLNILINDSLNGNAACYLAYSHQTKLVFLVRNQGPAAGLDGGFPLGGTGSASNSQCTINSAGSSAVVLFADTLQLNMNITFASPFQGNRLVYAAARDKTDTANSGWQLIGTHEVPGGSVTYPRAASMTPAAGDTAGATISYIFEDATSNTNLQTVWALMNNAVDGRQGCYIAYYATGNALYLIPDNGDGAQATSIPLSGGNTIENSQCRISAAGSSVARSGNRLTLTLNYTFKPAFAGYRGIWTAAQTLGGAQTSAWKPSGSWSVPAQ